MIINWKPTKTPELYSAVIAGFYCERLLIAKENRYVFSLGKMTTSCIKFSSQNILYQYLTL